MTAESNRDRLRCGEFEESPNLMNPDALGDDRYRQQRAERRLGGDVGDVVEHRGPDLPWECAVSDAVEHDEFGAGIALTVA